MSGRDAKNVYAPKPLASLPTETLEDILRWYALSDDDVSEERISEIISELKSREEGDSEPDIEGAINSFFEVYNEAETECRCSDECSSDTKDRIITPEQRRRRFSKAIIVLAAVITLLLATSLVAYATGHDMWRAVAAWTSELFGFKQEETERQGTFGSTTEPQLSEFTGIEEALNASGLSCEIDPSWVPEEFEGPVVSVVNLNSTLIVVADYYSGSRNIKIQAVGVNNDAVAVYEKDDEDVSTYVRGDVTHYIMDNIERPVAVWRPNGIECSISGDISQEELLCIINSIY